ncbi:MAG TPA: bifunctional phosphopantothenoylcysteine decarboxylase/phosphopantothenate--cysteine ligase CoaBC [Gammaproteobacteria bacterium]|nr:bifunctional phosphopantothenoylcysteine decarboxylase/phosphopantothenate--cysteine ligase CoaBC [Gammaproteobacteria bacterium]
MEFLAGKQILLGVTGSIAAYRSVELLRLLRRRGAQVRVVMTRAAAEFVGRRSFEALSGERVYGDWDDDKSGIEHIELARWADRILVAPASADTLARLALGRADDLLAAVCLASERPPALAPAMNQAMWRNAATQANLELLRTRGCTIWGPAEGEQACGEQGPGRMLEPAELAQALSDSFAQGALAGVRVLVTAGPTREPLDPVRFLSNRSSGRMGYAVAEAAREAGARVCLVSGPTVLDSPPGVRCVRVETAQEMLEAVLAELGDGPAAGCDLFIAAAAVADYRPARVAQHKIKKQLAPLELELEPAPDILATVSALEQRPFCVGFAAETGDVLAEARKKRMRKGVELIAANRVGPGLGFDVEDNELVLVAEDGVETLARAPKRRLARRLVAAIARYYRNGKAKRQRGHADDSGQDSRSAHW